MTVEGKSASVIEIGTTVNYTLRPQKIQYNLKVLAVLVGVEGGRASELKRVLKVTYNGFLLLSP